MAEAKAVLMPKLGQTVEESTIVSWHKQEGDSVKQGEVLFEIETDKAVLEAESFHDGTLLKILVGEGEAVPVQSVVAYIGREGDEIPAAPPPRAAAETSPEPQSGAPAEAKPAAGPRPATSPEPQPAAPRPSAAPVPEAAVPPRKAISPRARKLARQKVIDASGIAGSGPGGRGVDRDVIQYLEERGYDRLRITAAAKRLAAAEELDVLKIRGSGEGGRILLDDVKRTAREKPAVMSRMRQVVAERLTHSYTTVPHFFVTVAVDLTDLMKLRAEWKAQGRKLTVTDFIMQAVVMSLKDFDAVNSTTDGRQVWWHSRVHLGLAVSLEQGLVVPVIGDADTLTLEELHDQAAHLSARAREGKLTPDEMQGSTFTISNMGMMGVDQFTAIINPGESAILAVSSAKQQPAVVDGEIAIRTMMNITLSADHRLIDGALAARFVNAVKQRLEDIDLWRMLG